MRQIKFLWKGKHRLGGTNRIAPMLLLPLWLSFCLTFLKERSYARYSVDARETLQTISELDCFSVIQNAWFSVCSGTPQGQCDLFPERGFCIHSIQSCCS